MAYADLFHLLFAFLDVVRTWQFFPPQRKCFSFAAKKKTPNPSFVNTAYNHAICMPGLYFGLLRMEAIAKTALI